MTTPDELEHALSLRGATARLESLRKRDEDDAPLTRHEALELLALSEVVIRKAGYGRQLDVRTARATGASWAEIGTALGTTKQAAWEAHTRWLDAQHGDTRVAEHGGG